MSSVGVELLPPVLIVAPILAATLPIALGLWFDRTGWPVAGLTTLGLFAGALALAREVYAGGEAVTHELGGYPRTYGIQLVADEFSMLIVLLVTAVALGVLAYTRQGGPRGNTFYTAYLLLTGGLLGISLTGDVFNLFVFLEITSLATYALVASGDGPKAAVAALKYLILGTVAASMYLIGVAFVLMATGTLNMAELATEIPGAENPTLVRAGLAFMIVGFATKVAQWPLHTWQPSAYNRAPDGVTPLIAALVSTASAYAFGRLIVSVFGVDYLASIPRAGTIVVTIGCVSVLLGTGLAVIQREVKRMLAYSSVSQFGLVLAAYGVVIAGQSETAFVGAAIHLVGHGLLKAGLFLSAALVATSYGARTVDEYAGLAKDRPVAAGAMAVLLLALVGVPPGVGFVGKWYIAVGAVQSELWPVAAVIFLSTMLTLAYAARLLEKMYFTPSTPAERPHAPGTGAAATDGGTDDGTSEADAAPGTVNPAAAFRTKGSPDAVSTGMLAVGVVAAVAAVALGFAGGTIADMLAPFLTEVFN